MDTAYLHIARQPILDNQLRVFAYELLFRKSMDSIGYDAVHPDQATYDVITNTFLMMGIDTITSGRPAFINFTAKALKHDIPLLLPKQAVVVEILEDVAPDEELIAHCQRLKKEGYKIALDDFVYERIDDPLIALADIIKVDFIATPRDRCREIVEKFRSSRIKFLAEKIETAEDFQAAMEMGYSLFQGYFFYRPETLSQRRLAPAVSSGQLAALRELANTSIDLDKLERIIKQDVSLSYQLLKFINSSIFGLKSKISSVRQVLALLGQRETQKWLLLLSLKNIAGAAPDELISNSLFRASFAEKLAKRKKIDPWEQEKAFLMGLFSHIDALLSGDRDAILRGMKIDEEIRFALAGGDNCRLCVLYQLMSAYEKGDWVQFHACSQQYGLPEKDVQAAYCESLQWISDFAAIG